MWMTFRFVERALRLLFLNGRWKSRFLTTVDPRFVIRQRVRIIELSIQMRTSHYTRTIWMIHMNACLAITQRFIFVNVHWLPVKSGIAALTHALKSKCELYFFMVWMTRWWIWYCSRICQKLYQPDWPFCIFIIFESVRYC